MISFLNPALGLLTGWMTPLRLALLASIAAAAAGLWWEYTRQLNKIAELSAQIGRQASEIEGYQASIAERDRLTRHLLHRQHLQHRAEKALLNEQLKQENRFNAIRNSLDTIPRSDASAGPAVTHVLDRLREQQTTPSP
ncbi:MAG: hypothetical protein Alpg2KO_00720 [Alphaproteobacteria bacterium]